MEESIRRQRHRHLAFTWREMVPLTLLWMGQGVLVLIGMTLIGYRYWKEKRDAWIGALFLCGSAFVFGSLSNVYVIALLLMIVFCMIEAARLCGGNIGKWVMFGVVGSSAVYAMYLQMAPARIICILAAQILLFESDRLHMEEASRHFHITQTLIALSIAIWAAFLFPHYGVSLLAVVGVMLCLRAEFETALVTLLLLYGLSAAISAPLYYLFVIICAYFRQNLFLLSVSGIGGAVFFSSWLLLGIYGCFVCAYLYERLTKETAAAYVCTNQQKDFKRRLHNFSAIFDTLAEYYATISPVQSEILGHMAEALSYSASIMYLHALREDRENKIRKTLEVYRYEIEHFYYEENEEGMIHIALTLCNLKAQEGQETILPLLESLCDCQLEIKKEQSRRFLRNRRELVLESVQPFVLDAYADSLRKESRCGDSFSIFAYRQYRICMISDGMGSGDRAATVSRSMTTIFQRMISSDIPMDISVRCMNRLLQSDVFATMDVITFDLNQKLAYIFKSAACPTFLIRGDELLEISGNNLPVGILNALDADCYTLQLRENDAFLMFSDGVYMNEIYEWLRMRKGTDAKAQVEAMMEILTRVKRKDDSTIVYAKVLKNHS
ncbi:SpoIIE family protein phosphatase [Massilicoli timonensis]|uniref:SpoIIE family protein phosphatase n=1 Tax=Massilicoli timonensis TaxID=2015901 RepID=UPI0030799C2A